MSDARLSFIANIPRPGAGYCKRRLCRSGGPTGLAQPLVEILADRGHQRLDPAVEEMVGAGNDLLLDDDAVLGLQLLDWRLARAPIAIGQTGDQKPKLCL
jgi:hypothetical protein